MRRTLPALAILLAPAAAAAHIRITSPTPRLSDQLKERHCGMAGSTRANVQTYKPGSLLHLVWDEYVVHPGWFRVSFQQNGDTFEVPPASNGPSSSGASNYPTEDLTGKTDPGTGSLIIADRIVHGTLSLDVTLPNVECNNCTLQLTQMMIDKPPYSAATTSDDIYYACVDLVLSAAPVRTAAWASAPAPEPRAAAAPPAAPLASWCWPRSACCYGGGHSRSWTSRSVTSSGCSAISKHVADRTCVHSSLDP